MSTVLLAPIFQQLLTRVQSGALPIHGPVAGDYVTFGNIYREVCGHGQPITEIIVGHELFTSFTSDPAWLDVLDLVSDHQQVLNGQIGRMFGADVWTAQFTDPTHPHGKLMRSLPGLIIRTVDNTFYFYSVHHEVKPDAPTMHVSTASESLLLQELISRVDQDSPMQQSYLSHLRLALQIIGCRPAEDSPKI